MIHLVSTVKVKIRHGHISGELYKIEPCIWGEIVYTSSIQLLFMTYLIFSSCPDYGISHWQIFIEITISNKVLSLLSPVPPCRIEPLVHIVELFCLCLWVCFNDHDSYGSRLLAVYFTISFTCYLLYTKVELFLSSPVNLCRERDRSWQCYNVGKESIVFRKDQNHASVPQTL